MTRWLKRWALLVRRDALALWFAAPDRRVPLRAKLLAALVAAYAVSPVDLVPEPVPVLGVVDDLVLVPMGIWLTIRLIPDALMTEFRARALRTRRHVTWAAVIGIVVICAAVLALTWFLVSR